MNPLNDNIVRIEEFKSEIEGLKLKGGSAEGESRLLAAGVILCVAGVLFAIAGAIRVASFGDSPGDQRAILAQGSFLGIALIIAGAALFIRFSLARYMRFWLIRLTYESRANTDRIVEAIERSGGVGGRSTGSVDLSAPTSGEGATASAEAS